VALNHVTYQRETVTISDSCLVLGKAGQTAE